MIFKKFIAVLLIPLAFFLCGCSSSPDLKGTWTATGSNNMPFEAIIGDNTIAVNVVSNGTKALYWKGNFQIPSGASDNLVIESVGDQDALKSSILGSQDGLKEFTYTGGQLLFDYSIMGVSQRVTLVRK